MTAGYVTDQHPLHAAILTRPAPRITGIWLIAQVPVTATYSCRCRLGTTCTTAVNEPDPSRWCRCYGRTDLERLPSHCCAKRPAQPSTLEEPP